MPARHDGRDRPVKTHERGLDGRALRRGGLVARAGRRGRVRRPSSAGRGAERLLDGLDQAVGPERLVQDGLEPLLARLDDRVRGVVAEPGHQDDRHLRLDLAEPAEGLVAVEVGQADVDQGGRIGGLPRQGDRLVGVAGRLDGRPLAAEQVVGRAPDRLVGVDDQQPGARPAAGAGERPRASGRRRSSSRPSGSGCGSPGPGRAGAGAGR